MQKAGAVPDEIAAVGITNQRETTVVWDKATGEPIANAPVWSSAHTHDICAKLERQGGQDQFRAKTGLPVATYFSGSKIQWLLDNVPGARKKSEAGELLFGNTDAWLTWNLTGGPNGGVHATDVTNASRVQLMDLETLAWDDELLNAFNVPRSMLPEIRPSSGDFGVCAGAAVGVPELEGVPITGVLGDQQAALFGQAGFEVGDAKNTYGTGCFLLMNTGEVPVPSTHGLLTTVAYQLEGQPAVYALEGSVSMGGATIQWLRDNLELIKDAKEVEAIAASVEDNGGCYLVPAFTGLYAPHWKTDARGVVCGLTRFVTKAHICR
jgi:glycerol kinase